MEGRLRERDEMPSSGTVASSPETKAAGSSERVSDAPAAPIARGLQPMNDLFAEAMDAKRRGDKSSALAALHRLETQYPSSHSRRERDGRRE